MSAKILRIRLRTGLFATTPTTITKQFFPTKLTQKGKTSFQVNFICHNTLNNKYKNIFGVFYFSECAFLYLLSALSHPVTNFPRKLLCNYSYFQLLYYYGLSDLSSISVCQCVWFEVRWTDSKECVILGMYSKQMINRRYDLRLASKHIVAQSRESNSHQNQTSRRDT